MYHPFSVAETIKTSWDIFKKNFVTIIVYSVISFFLLGLLGLVIGFIYSPKDFWGSMVVTFILIWLQAYTTLGLYKLIFTVIDSEYYDFEFIQVIPKAKMVWSYLVVVFIFAFLVTNLTILIDKLDNNPDIQFTVEVLAGVLGLYLALRAMFFNTFIVDDASGPIESLKQSFQLTKGYLLKVVLILGIIILLIALPAKLAQYYQAPFISITILFTYPFVNIVLAVTYRKLIYSHQDVDDDIAETN